MKLWYAVCRDNGDTDWGYGNENLEVAKSMARKMRDNGNPDTVIVVVDDGADPVALEEITDF